MKSFRGVEASVFFLVQPEVLRARSATAGPEEYIGNSLQPQPATRGYYEPLPPTMTRSCNKPRCPLWPHSFIDLWTWGSCPTRTKRSPSGFSQEGARWRPQRWTASLGFCWRWNETFPSKQDQLFWFGCQAKKPRLGLTGLQATWIHGKSQPGWLSRNHLVVCWIRATCSRGPRNVTQSISFSEAN